MTYLFDLFLPVFWTYLAIFLVQFHFVVIIIRVNDEKGNFKPYFLKDSHLKMFT